MVELSQEAQQTLMSLQISQQQLQNVMAQKEGLKMQEMEIDRALEELKKSKDDDVYKAVGPILIKTAKKDLEKELGDRQETGKIRLKSLENEETQLKERMETQQKKLQEMLKTEEEPKEDAG